ncbi:MAG: glutamine amidotransferase-related protein [Hyphomicrobiales bacterium]
MPAPRILAIVHHGPSDAGRAPWHLERAGYAVEYCAPVDGDALPADLGAYAGAAVFGGIMSANDDHLPGIRVELDWITKAVDAGCPLLGICLGGQLIARALGGSVERHDDGLWEIGYYPLEPTAAGLDLMPEPRPAFYQWHQDGFHLPSGAELLAEGGAFRNQFYRYGETTYGLQFHPEVTPELIVRWMDASPGFEQRPGGQTRQQQLDGAARHQATVDDWFGRFLRLWIGAQQGAARQRSAG